MIPGCFRIWNIIQTDETIQNTVLCAFQRDFNMPSTNSPISEAQNWKAH